MFWTRCLLLMAALGAVLGLGCDGLEEQDAPRIVVAPSELQFDSVAVGSTTTSFVTVSNQGLVDLNISSISLELTTDFVTITSATSLVVGPGAEEIVTLSFTPTTPANTEGSLVFRSNDPLNSELRVPVGSPLLIPGPNIVRKNPDIAPDVLDFGLVAEGTTTTLDRVIQNVGEAPLIICNAFVTGSPDVTSDLATALQAARNAQGLVVVAPLTSDTGESQALEFELTYAPPSPGADEADLVIEYDEQGFLDQACAEERIQTTRFPITGEAGSPFLRVNPNPVNFGESPVNVTSEEVVTLTNAGELPLEIFNVRLDRDRTPGEFQLVDSSQIPAVVPAGESVSVLTTYLPRAELGHAGVLQIEHADGAGGRRTTEVAMAGVGVPDTCPVAIARAYVQEALGKALGVGGAFVAGSEDLIETLVQAARTYIYTTATPPAMAAATLASLDLLDEEYWRIERLQALVRHLRDGAMTRGLALMASSTAIQPLLVGPDDRAVRVSEALLKAGFLVVAIRPPTVPEGMARLRITLRADHEYSDLDALLDALADIVSREEQP